MQNHKLIPLLVSCFVVVAIIASCNVSGEESFDFKQANSSVIEGPSEIAKDSTGSFNVKAFTINKNYTWTVDGNEVESRRKGEYIDLTPAELRFYNIKVQGPDYSGSTVVDVTGFVPEELQAEGYTLLADAIDQAGLTDTLEFYGKNEYQYTVFAPTDSAMLAALDTNKNGSIETAEYPTNISDILSYHVVGNLAAPSASIEDSLELTTLQGSNILFQINEDADGNVTSIYLNPGDEKAQFTANDSSATNGIIHGIDTVLIPNN